MPHMRRREGDEFFCPRCARRWGVDEAEPEHCIDTRPPNKQARPDQISYDLIFEAGFKACERGDNLLQALATFKETINGTVRNPKRD